jgi:Zn-dependent peptidase ImmA (M78 family)/DNA-binding XRE family transcriptional regulator
MKERVVSTGRNTTDFSPKKIGDRIRDLRRSAHLSQIELAQYLGIQQGPISNLENGKHMPSARVLIALATFFEVSIDALLGIGSPHSIGYEKTAELKDEDIEIYSPTPDLIFAGSPDGVHWLPTSKAARLPGEKLARKLESLIRDYLALEDICGVPRLAQIPLELPIKPLEESVIKIALQMRTLLGVGEAVIFDHLELLENHCLRVIFTELKSGLDSLSYLDLRHRNLFIFIASDINPERQIFRLMYELGRALLTGRLGELVTAPDEAVNDKTARLFAANFLMPESVVRQSVCQVGVLPDEWDFELLLRLKHRFGVSAQTFSYRLLELELIEPELQGRFREVIEAHYARHAYAEPGKSRRILSPNGRLGDLLHIALKRGDPEAQEIAQRFEEIGLNVN